MNNQNNFFSFSRNLENKPNAVQGVSVTELDYFHSLQNAFNVYSGSL